MKRIPLLAIVTFSCVSCASYEVSKTMAVHSEKAGQTFSDEVIAQSHLSTVEMSWSEAKELMRERNSAFVKAAEKQSDAEVTSPLVSNLMDHMQGSLGSTVMGALSARDIIKVAKTPIEEIPKHFENLASLKDFSHNMQLKAYEKVKESSTSEQTIRNQEVELFSLFKQHHFLKKRDLQLADWERQEELSSRVASSVKKERTAWKTQRGKWLDKVRDFFNAEYGDVRFTNVPNAFPSYKSVKDPQFDDYKRWRVLQRSQKLASDLKLQHAENKAVVPGANFVKHKLTLMTHADAISNEPVDNEKMRGEVRELLRNWRLLKESHARIGELKKQNSTTPAVAKTRSLSDSGKVDPMVEFKNQKLIMLEEMKALKLAKKIWLMDEQCWDEAKIH